MIQSSLILGFVYIVINNSLALLMTVGMFHRAREILEFVNTSEIGNGNGNRKTRFQITLKSALIVSV